MKNEGKEVTQNFINFIKNRTKLNVSLENRIIKITNENNEISKKYLKVLSKKFLHKAELKDFYRILSINEDTIKVREKKVYEE